jgi:pentafunctional AROM polypeptide
MELRVFERLVADHPTGHVIACGGGLVETPAALERLVTLPLVVQISRDIAEIEAYLNKDTLRPAFDVRSAWDRRKPMFKRAASIEFNIPTATDGSHEFDVNIVGPELDGFVRRALGLSTVPLVGPGSFFLSLTYGTVAEALPVLDTISEGVDALELRVDLLAAAADPEKVLEEYATLRRATTLPIIFTVRSKAQGGKFPDDEKAIFHLLSAAVRHGCPYIDMESHWSQESRNALIDQCKRFGSQIIGSHHIWNGNGGSEADLRALFRRVSHGGRVDFVKVVVFAKEHSDAMRLLTVGQSMSAAGELNDTAGTPQRLIMLAMGEQGKLSRVLNPVFTPVTHPSLPAAAAPGQMSVAAIQTTRAHLGLLTPKTFHIFGSPVAMSPSPLMHNTAFQWLALPHRYSRMDTSSPQECVEAMRKPGFGGASVTIPLKEQLLEHMDSLSPAVQAIGALNTVTRTEAGTLAGDNTDWLGIKGPLTPLLGNTADKVGIVVGAGGTARAALFALQQMGITGQRLLIHNRTAEKAEGLAKEFGCRAVTSLDAAALGKASGKVAVLISTVPGSAGFTAPAELLAQSPAPVVFDVSYLPKEGTALCQQALKQGCTLVRGIDMLIAQGKEQSHRWTGGRTGQFERMTAVATKAFAEGTANRDDP